MNRKVAALVIVTVSLVLVALLATRSIPPVAAGLVFAAALAAAGVLSGGFRK
jgi:hypothetical protein